MDVDVRGQRAHTSAINPLVPAPAHINTIMPPAVPNQKEIVAQPKADLTAQNVVDLLRDLTRAYTKHHDSLQINGGPLSGSIALSVQGHEADHGKLVGERGANIWALTTLFEAIGRRIGKSIMLTLLKPNVGVRGGPDRFESDPNFKHNQTTTLLRRTLAMVFASPFRLAHNSVPGHLYYEVTPEAGEAMPFGGDVLRAVHAIFHAIGKSRGCLIYVRLFDPSVGSSSETPPPAPAAPAAPRALQPPRMEGMRPPPAPPVDAIDAEAQRRGFVQP